MLIISIIATISSFSFNSLDNIIYDSRQKKITIIDFSDVAVAEKETDLVIFSEYNHQLYSLKRFLSFIKSEITTPNSRKAFVKLAIFYLFQTAKLRARLTASSAVFT